MKQQQKPQWRTSSGRGLCWRSDAIRAGNGWHAAQPIYTQCPFHTDS